MNRATQGLDAGFDAEITPRSAEVELARTIRFCLHPTLPRLHGAPTAHQSTGCNTFAGWPAMIGLGVHYAITVHCRGCPDPVTGYFMNITEIDHAARALILPRIEQVFQHAPDTEPGAIMAELIAMLQPALRDSVRGLCWRLSPYHAVVMHAHEPDRVTLTETFEFAAAHRLHCAELADEENRAIFGKCNNPNGHGHNYLLDVAVSCSLLDTPAGSRFTRLDLERLVKEVILDRFDHKHLNLDTAEFAEKNPSVEFIAQVCYDLLAAPVEGRGGRLESITVWETGKTRCTYPAGSSSFITDVPHGR